MTRAGCGATTPDEPSHAALEQAAGWYACLRDGRAGLQEQAAWREWLQAKEEHKAAWRYVEEISRGFEPLRGIPEPRLTADALGVAGNRLHDRVHPRRRVLASAALLAGGGLLGWLSWREAMLSPGILAWAADQCTGTGEQRDITLGDGTQLWLNTASGIDLRFNAQERRVVLLTGEIFIDTAKDSTRPFLVDTPHGRMRALGTRFNVRLEAADTRLAVFDGAVEIRTSASGASRVIPAGQQVRFHTGGIAASAAADMAREAWTQGTLVADNISLREVLAELRRYRKGHLGIADEIADLKVYGSFPIHDPDRVLRMLASALPIRIEQPLPWWTRIEARR